MKKFLLLSCFFLLSCQDEIPEINTNYLNRGDKIRIKNTEIVATVLDHRYYNMVEFYYEDDFGTLHKEQLNMNCIEKVVDNP